jgi:iron complex transport system ATP-binding protein
MTIEATGLRASLAGREVLKGISFSAHAGELTAVIGPNGAGKSTLLRVIAGLVPADAGTVSLGDRRIADWSRAELARVLGYLPQDRMVHWPLAARIVVGLGRLPHRSTAAAESPQDVAAIETAMTSMHVAHFADRPVTSLSGGERARVLLARVLAQQPRVLLADEPAAGLDPAQQLALFQHLTRIAADGCTVVVAVHDLSLAARFCHSIALVHDGAAVAAGRPADVLTPVHLAATYGIDARYHVIDGIPVVLPIGVLP